MKIVINACFGGFGLSNEVVLKYFELNGKEVYPRKTFYGYDYCLLPPDHPNRIEDIGDKFYYLPMDERQAYNKRYSEQFWDDRNIDRTDPILIKAIEEIGEKESSGRFSDLKIIEIPDDVQWYIEEYGGSEYIAEVHRTWP